MTNFTTPQLNHTQAPAQLHDIVQRHFVCAELGLPFVATFKRDSSGVYVWTKSDPMTLGLPVGQGDGAFQDDIPVSKMRWTEFECAWCDAKPDWPEVIHCGACLQFVCSGRTVGTSFKCTDECGNSGELKDTFKSVRVVDGLSGNLDGSSVKLLTVSS